MTMYQGTPLYSLVTTSFVSVVTPIREVMLFVKNNDYAMVFAWCKIMGSVRRRFVEGW